MSPPAIPVLELQHRVPKILLQRYTTLMGSTAFIPCEHSIRSVSGITWASWRTRLLAERLARKAAVVDVFLRQNNYHWEEACWWLLANNFGMKVNAEAFENVARSIPLAILAKHKSQVHQLEALLLGQAGLLDKNFSEDYPVMLQKEYRFMQAKYHLRPTGIPLYSLRMRPSNFPAIRLAELAMLIHQSSHLFSKIKESATAGDTRKLFQVTANDYWHYHYRFDEASAFKMKSTGSSMIDHIMINTVAPLLFAYGSYYNDNGYKDKAIACLEETPAELNQVTRGFAALDVPCKNAGDSQALVELRNEYCTRRRCLECSVGSALLRQPDP
jgi:hypothetical protein